MSTDLLPYRVHVPDADLADLRERLRRTRWPEAATVPGWTQGVPRDHLQDLCRYWADGYDWRIVEARLNAVPQYRTTLDGLDIHVLHARSPHTGALPLIVTHGWPGSVLEYLDMIRPLTDPPAYGGTVEDAFDVVIPSLPGYGFSGKPTTSGWNVERIAGAWAQLMTRLGYDRYGAAGSDWGTSITSALAAQDAEHVAGIHLIPPLAGPDPDTPDLTDAERAAPPAPRCSPRRCRSPPGDGRPATTPTSDTGPSTTEAATSPPWRCPTSSSTTCAPSSAGFGDPTNPSSRPLPEPQQHPTLTLLAPRDSV